MALDQSDQSFEAVERCLSVPLLPQQVLPQLHAPLQTGNSINFLPPTLACTTSPTMLHGSIKDGVTAHRRPAVTFRVLLVLVQLSRGGPGSLMLPASHRSGDRK